ncbi:sulfurtransferase TusA family protein [Jiella sp. M17.18]|uniref:sulfurtransferase TusA family protein n=1 Tax=Jiella sp. M17.18 TaxID=3234247 RepID=UPI0034DE1D86
MEIDLRGLKCPLPALYTERRLARMQAGDALEVLADDPLAAIDIPHACRSHGHRLAETTREGEAIRFRIVVGDAAS